MTADEPLPEPIPTALVGADYPGLRIRPEVAEGDAVEVGQVLFRDRKRPEIAFVSPIRGRVSAIRYGPRRMLSIVSIDPVAAGKRTPAPQPAGEETGDLRSLLLERGFWPAFVARPFGGPPDPDAQPDAIVVTATPGSDTAPDPAKVLAGREAAFAHGLEALTGLTEGLVHLCQGQGGTLWSGASERIRVSRFRAGRGGGTAGAQVHRLYPVGPGRRVWTIGYQDVAAIGHLLETGMFDPVRTVAVRMPVVAGSRFVRVPLGADLRHLTGAAEANGQGAPWLVSGSAAHGREATWLGRHHDEVTGLARPARRATAAPSPLIPLAGLDRAIPFDIPAVPLMRALSIGDVERCRTLGCLELLEEDVAPLTALCTSGTDYGRCLRAVLDQIGREAA